MAGWSIWNPRARFVSRPSMATQIYYRFAWTDQWTWLPEAWCSQIEDRVAPGSGSASIVYDFGVILPPGQTSAVAFPPAGLLGAYVLVEGVNIYGRLPLWVGVVIQEDSNVWGNANAPTGTQQYLAVTLDHLLDRVEIRGAHTITGQTDRPIAFNAVGGFGGGVTPNLVVDGNGWPVFGRITDGAIYWTHRAVVDYVMYWFAPGGLSWHLINPDFVEQLGIVSARDYDGFTIKQVLDDIFDRRRGLGWCVRTDIDANTIGIYAFSQLAEPVSIGDFTIPANPAQTDVFYEGVHEADPRFSFSETAYYDIVHVTGGPVYTTLTFGETLMPQASIADGSEGYVDGEDVRLTREASYELIKDWNWTAPGGYNAAPGVAPDGELDPGGYPDVFNYGRALERQLPFLGVSGEPRAPLALTWVDGKWQLAEYAKTDEADLGLGVRLADDSVGFSFLYSLPREDAASPLPAMNNWLLTATLETDRRLSVWIALSGVTDAPRVKMIAIPEAVAHWVVPETVVDITPTGEPITYNGNATYYSDAPMLRNVAALAAAWYSRRRSTLDVQISGITIEYLPGSLIRESRTSWFSAPVETVVTDRVWDFRQQTTTVKTAYDELAVTQVLR